ncbi:MAG: hypothetical protein ACLQU1_39795 [Bryobacteraceae bacterium]
MPSSTEQLERLDTHIRSADGEPGMSDHLAHLPDPFFGEARA